MGKWKQGVINGLVAGLMLVAAGAMGGVWAEEIHYVWLVLASGSAGWAHAVAVNMTGDTGVTKPDMGFHEKPIQPAP